MKNRVLVIVSMALAPCWALAQNGVVLINQATVAASGANRSTGGFPYVITQPGSYQLSGNLTVPAGVNGIVISASLVSLDLNGFNISCVGSCSGNGITNNNTPQSGTTIRNGTVFGFHDGIGLDGSTGSFIDKVRAQSNGIGILVGDSSTVKDCLALNNISTGIFARKYEIVSGNVSSGNDVGITVASGTLTGNTATSNSNRGFDVSDGNSTLTGNTASNNGFLGFDVGSGSTLTGNTASANGAGVAVNCPVNLVGNTAVGPFLLSESGAGCNKVNNLGF